MYVRILCLFVIGIYSKIILRTYVKVYEGLNGKVKRTVRDHRRNDNVKLHKLVEVGVGEVVRRVNRRVRCFS